MLFTACRTVLFLILALSWSSLLDARTWTHQDGRTFEGELIGYEDEVAVIRRDSDQQEFEVNIAVLSEPDQEFARNNAPLVSFNADTRLKILFIAWAILMLSLSLYWMYRAGRFVGIPNWTFSRSIVWHLYNWFLGLLSNIATVLYMYFTKPGFDPAEYYTGNQAMASSEYDIILLSVFFFFFLLYLYAKFLKISMLRTFGFMLLESLVVVLAAVCALIVTFCVAWPFGLIPDY